MTSATTPNPAPEAHSGVGASSSSIEIATLLQGAAVATLDHAAWIRVTGQDRVRWLNGMATNSIQDLATGAGTYNFFLNAQGRIQADGYVFAEHNALLIETSRQQVSSLISYLDHYIIMDDVELADVTGSRHGITVIGPKTAELLRQLSLAASDLKELETRTLLWQSETVSLIHAYSPLVPRYELWTESPSQAASLLEALTSAGASSVHPESLEWLRVFEGTPLSGVDIRDRDLPQETNQNRALHFAKGCYLGQEIIERIRSRGNVHRTFTAFRLEGTAPAPGTTLETDGKQVGELTSVAAIRLNDSALQVGLGYIRREMLDRQARIEYPGGVAIPVASPIPEAQAITAAFEV